MTLGHSLALVDHLWQSTLFAVLVWLATMALRSNGARVRFWLWTAASIKFLVPLSMLRENLLRTRGELIRSSGAPRRP